MAITTPVQQREKFDPGQHATGMIAGLVGGIVAGAAAGVVARLAMRAIAILAGETLEFTVEGTLLVVWSGILLGALGGLAFGAVQPIFRGSLRLKGLLFGLGLVFLFAVLIVSSAELGGEVSAYLMLPVPLIYGLVLGPVAGRLAPKVDEKQLLRAGSITTVVFATAGLGFNAVRALAHPTLSIAVSDRVKLLNDLVGALLILTAVVATVALSHSRAHGQDRLGKTGLAMSLLGAVTLAAIALPIILLSTFFDGVGASRLEPWVAIPMLVLGIGLLLTGAAVARTGIWAGWRRYSPLLAGVYPFLAIIILLGKYPGLIFLPGSTMAARFELGHWLGAAFALSWLPLALSLWAESRQGQEARLGRPAAELS